MKKIKYFLSIMLLAGATGSVPAAPHIGFLMPAGGQQGTTVDVIIGGQSFWGTREAWISGTGVTVENVQFVPGLPNISGSQRSYVNKVLRNYHAKKPNDIPVPEDQSDWRKHNFYTRLYELTDCERDILYRFMFVPRNSLQASPAISGRAIVRLKIASDAPAGVREFRLIARDGSLSNPLKFIVGKVPEYREGFFPYPPAKQIMPEITVPSAVNGQITPGECDRYKFKAVKDQVITFKLYGRFFNPFIGDGVPGHFQPVLEVFDSSNNTLAFADDYFFDPDPVLTFKAPADGIYTLAVRDAIYRGREDFVYRVDVMEGTLPLPDAPAPQVATVPLKDFSKDLSVKAVSSREVTYPVVIKNALSSPRGDRYAVKLKKDEEIVLEIFARRLALPPDMVIKVFDANNKLIAFNDDVDRLKAGTILHNTADSLLYFKAPADGVYYLTVSDVANAYGSAYKYYLRIDRKRTRFAVYSTPSSLRLTAGCANQVKLTVERFDRFNGEIKVRVKSPANYKIIGSDVIPGNCSSTVLTLAVPQDKTRKIQELVLEASADDFTTKVIAGNEATQAFAYTHIIPAETFPVRVMGASRGMMWKNDLRVLKLLPGKVVTAAALPPNWAFPADIQLELKAVNLPDWVKVVPNPRSKVKTFLKKEKRRRAYVVTPEMQFSLQGTADGAGKSANVLFKVVWTETTRPDKNGKVRRYNREILLPAIRIEGGKN